MHVPNGNLFSQVLWTPKKYVKGHPPRPIVSSRDSVTYGMAKVMAGILEPLVGRSDHYVHNADHFIEQMKNITLELGECYTSIDVTAFFIPVPVATALNIV